MLLNGYPDFVAFKDDYGAQRILIGTGEIQSMSDLDTQNSIYAVGSLLNHMPAGHNAPIICITVFKRKFCTLALARLNKEQASVPNSVGTVSLKYFVSPSPIDLLSDLKIFVYRLYILLKLMLYDVNIPLKVVAL